MKFILSLLTPFLLSGCFFVVIPGSVTRAVGDAFTGAEGNNCIAASAKVGDILTMPEQNPRIVKSISGTSTYCKNPARPIRALLEEVSPEHQ